MLSLPEFLSLNGMLGRCRQQASGRSPCGRLGLGVSPCTPGFWEEFSAPRESFVYKTQPLNHGRVPQTGLECWSPGTSAPCRVRMFSVGEDTACGPGFADGLEMLLLR